MYVRTMYNVPFFKAYISPNISLQSFLYNSIAQVWCKRLSWGVSLTFENQWAGLRAHWRLIKMQKVHKEYILLDLRWWVHLVVQMPCRNLRQWAFLRVGAPETGRGLENFLQNNIRHEGLFDCKAFFANQLQKCGASEMNLRGISDLWKSVHKIESSSTFD